MKNIAVIILVSLLLSCEFQPKSTEINNKERDALTEDLNKIYTQGFINGFSVSIVNQRKTLYQHGFGYADIENEELYTVHTVQNIASISKTFIGIALLKAQELGKLKLDDPVNKYLPFEIKNQYYPNKDITIRMLATHTSSIKDTEFYGGKSYILKDSEGTMEGLKNLYVTLNAPMTDMPMIDFLERVLPKEGVWYQKEGFLNNEPGALFEYSNVGATLAAVVLEKATGIPFDKFTDTHILKPLGMTESGWNFENINMDKHAKLYLNPTQEIPFYKLITYPDGGLITNVDDLSKYLKELIRGYSGDGILLAKESYQEFFTKQLEAENFQNKAGENEGIFLSFSSDGLIGHSGGDPGVSTFMFFNPDSKVGSIVLVNTDFGPEGAQQYEAIIEMLDASGK